MSHKSCSSCSVPIKENAKFCGHCGYRLDGLPQINSKIEPSLKEVERIQKLSFWGEFRVLAMFYGSLLFLSFFFGLMGHFSGASETRAFYYWGFVTTVDFFFLTRFWGVCKKTLVPRIPSIRIVLEIFIVLMGAFVFLKGYFFVLEYFQWPMVNYANRYQGVSYWWLPYLMMAVLPGVLEEIAFRGIIQTKLRDFLGETETVVVQAALFSVLHLSPIIFVSHFVMGLTLGWLRQRTGHIYFGILVHMFWNGMVLYQQLLRQGAT